MSLLVPPLDVDVVVFVAGRYRIDDTERDTEESDLWKTKDNVDSC